MRSVVSLGGSIVVPDGIDTELLRALKRLLEGLVAEGHRFALIVGGGKTCRRYQAAARELADVSNEDLDWIGIATTHLNAQLIRTVLGVDGPIITNPHGDPLPDAPLIIGAGWQPGHSTDFDAVVLAERLGASQVINLSNISHVYSADPKQDPSAHPLDALTWDEFIAIVGEEWSPGLSAPFDPVAAKRCRDLGLTVGILSADDMENVRAALRGDSFRGTVIR